jgi:Domain of unknown function (DUF4830)
MPRCCANLLILTGLLVITVVGLIGCQSETEVELQIPQAHEDYISSFGWTVEKALYQTQHPNGYYTGERLNMLKNAGVDLSPYADKEIKVSAYLLKEKQEYGSIYFTIYEVDANIIGAHLSYEGYAPGLVKLRKRE